MSSMAILFLLTAAQVNDGGWQPNTQARPSVPRHSVTSETSRAGFERPAGSRREPVEPTSFDDRTTDDLLGDSNDTRDIPRPSDHLEDELDPVSDRFDDRDTDLNRDLLDDDFFLTDRDRPTESRNRDRLNSENEEGSFWDENDLFLDDFSANELQSIPRRTPHSRFRWIASEDPIPPLPRFGDEDYFLPPDRVANDVPTAEDLDDLGPLERQRRRRRRDTRSNAEEGLLGGIRSADRGDPFRRELDVRQPAPVARELNGPEPADQNTTPSPDAPDDTLHPVPNENARNKDDDAIRNAMDRLDFSRIWKVASVPSGSSQIVDDKLKADSPVAAAASRSWWPFVFAMVAFFASLGFNIYLGWIAWDLHGRYQDVVEELAELESEEEERDGSVQRARHHDELSQRPERSSKRRRSFSV